MSRTRRLKRRRTRVIAKRRLCRPVQIRAGLRVLIKDSFSIFLKFDLRQGGLPRVQSSFEHPYVCLSEGMAMNAELRSTPSSETFNYKVVRQFTIMTV